MSQFVFKMPDLGEGTVEAEIVAWHTKPGDSVDEDQVIVEVMTDKAAVEVPAPVSGRVLSITGEPGDKIAVGSPLIVFEVAASGATAAGTLQGPAPATPVQAATAPPVVVSAATAVGDSADNPSHGPVSAPAAQREDSPPLVRAGRVMTSPAVRRRAHEAGIDLATVAGSGPGGRILGADLAAKRAAPAGGGPATADTTEIKVIGVRRLIAERMSHAKRSIPHFAYVEEVDVTELDALRVHLNATSGGAAGGNLTYLPFVVLALVRAVQEFPQCNVRYDAAREVLVRHRAVHVGIATQTPDGLKVPVVRDAQNLALHELSAEIRRISDRARTNKSTREELGGSTITVTSLGKLGGIASTPVINAPEVAIVGLNKAVERPVVLAGAVVVRRIMNLSSSFDHRFVDGYDAAAMIQFLKDLLEHPATIFIPKVISR